MNCHCQWLAQHQHKTYLWLITTTCGPNLAFSLQHYSEGRSYIPHIHNNYYTVYTIVLAYVNLQKHLKAYMHTYKLIHSHRPPLHTYIQIHTHTHTCTVYLWHHRHRRHVDTHMYIHRQRHRVTEMHTHTTCTHIPTHAHQCTHTFLQCTDWPTPHPENTHTHTHTRHILPTVLHHKCDAELSVETLVVWNIGSVCTDKLNSSLNNCLSVKKFRFRSTPFIYLYRRFRVSLCKH